MRDGKNIESKKNKRSCEILEILDIIHSKVWYIGKREGFGKYKRSSNKVWEEDEYKSKEARKVEYSRRKRL